MGLFDKVLLSAKSSITNAASNAAGQAMSFAVAGATKKVSEAASSLYGTFGGVGSFTKIGANTPTINEMVSSAMISADPLLKGVEGLIGPVIGDSMSGLESSATASQMKSAAGVQSVTSSHMVCLKEVGMHGGSSGKSATNLVLYFEVLPEIVEQHVAEYEAIAPAQSPGAFQKYKGTSTTQWTLNAMFISRTSEEATRNYDNLQKLRGWTKPFYGKRTEASYENKLGAPPPVLMMSGLRNLIGPVPVVITSLNWNWPKDVDYIATTIQSDVDGNYIPFPTVLSVPIQLVESYSVDQFNNFSLADYRQGRLYHAFNQGELEVPESMQVRGVGDA